jgi:class 3 adenylate cyclase/tetratricopeptide (TPR) repeat protein
MRCPSCGFENASGIKFCGECGRRLAAAAVATPPTEPRAYTPKHLTEIILRSRAALAGERKQVTVVFVDVTGSMELADRVDPEEWHAILDRFFGIVAAGVHRFEGTVNQYTGDGVMALFGAPIAHEDHAQRACYAALDVRDEVRRYAEELKRRRGLAFRIRTGLNSGEVVVGRIGDDLRMDYTAQGQTVGLAARMQQLAEPGAIYLSEATAKLLAGYVHTRDLGDFAVKGVREPVRVHELEGVGPVRTRLELSRARGFSRLVGRARELEALESALARALEGSGQVVGIVGEPGVGKSRLVHELSLRCAARGIRVTEAHALPHGKAIPLLPWIEQLRSYFGVGERDADETARDKIAGRMLRLDEGLRDALPVMLDFLGVADPRHPAPPMEPEARSRALLDATRRLLRARSGEGPGVHIFEDLHWLDAGSEVFLAAMVEALPGTRTLLVVTARPGYEARWRHAAPYRELSLRPLQPADVRELLDDLLGRDPSVADLAARIERRAGGNPFFVEEIVRSLAEAGVLEGRRGARRVAGPVERVEIPPTVHGILAARIDRLGERDKSVLHTAAVIGRDFVEPVLRAVADPPVDDLEATLRALVDAELVRPVSLYPTPEYAFVHPLTQEVAYRSQLSERRSRTHARVAAALAEYHRERLDERAALLAHHWEAADERLEAARWSRRAARWSGQSDLSEALAHWRKVRALLDAVPESEETRPLALEARIWILGYGWGIGITDAEAAAVFAEGEGLAARAADHRSHALLIAQYAGVQAAHGQVEAYVRWTREAARVAEESGDPALRAALSPPLVRSHLFAGRLREALALAERALREVPPDPDAAALLGYSPYLNLLLLRANLLAYAGRWSDAVATFRRAADESKAERHQALHATVQSDLAWWAALFGDGATAVASARTAVAIAERSGSQLTRVFAYNALGVADAAAGRLEDAERALGEALRIAGEMQTGLETRVLALAHLADVHRARGERTLALRLVDEAIDESSRRGGRAWECFARLVHGRVALRVGGPGLRPAALASLERALALVEETGARCYEPFVRTELAEAARLAGDAAACRRERAAARRLLAEIGASQTA